MFTHPVKSRPLKSGTASPDWATGATADAASAHPARRVVHLVSMRGAYFKQKPAP
jgi:hypothetical protein